MRHVPDPADDVEGEALDLEAGDELTLFDLTDPEARAAAFDAAADAGNWDRAHEIARMPMHPNVARGRAPPLGGTAALGPGRGREGPGDRMSPKSTRRRSAGGPTTSNRRRPSMNNIKLATLGFAAFSVGAAALFIGYSTHAVAVNPPPLHSAATYLEKAYDAYVRRDYAAALRGYYPLASRGNATAQFYLGLMNESGWGTSRDGERAVYWYLKAAMQGHVEAMVRMAALYFHHGGIQEEGVPQDYKRAAYWYWKAAMRGDATAQQNIGYCYHTGTGVREDHMQAVYWYRKAALQGSSVSQSSLAQMYFNGGEGVPQDYERAAYWYRQAADPSDWTTASDMYRLGDMYDKGLGVPEDPRHAVYWYRAASKYPYSAGLGIFEALGWMYYHGRGVPQDFRQAESLFRKSVEHGYEIGHGPGDAMKLNSLGVRYAKGDGVPQNDEQAAYWFRIAAARGYAPAQGNIEALACKPLLVGFHGAKSPGIMRNLLYSIKSRVEDEQGVEVEHMMYGWRDEPERDATDFISEYHRKCPWSSIVLIGHSYGGDSAYDVANDIKWAVDLVVTLDSVSYNFEPTEIKGVRWVNIFRDNMPVVLRFVPPIFPLSMIFDDGCDVAASLGGVWGREEGANRNINATEESYNHCDAFGLYEPAQQEVVDALTR